MGCVVNAVRKIRWAALLGVLLIGLAAGAYWGLHGALRHEPAFYRSAVAIPRAAQQRAGREFERQVLELHNDVQRPGTWQRTFTQGQINGWLAIDLPEKFPELLPPSVSQPRVALTPNLLLIAFRYQAQDLETVVSLSLDVQLADEPNTLAIRVRQASAGWLPLPLSDFLDQISQAARRADLMLRWAQTDGDPVALVTLPRGTNPQEPFLLSLVQVGDGELVIAGQSLAEASADTTLDQTEDGRQKTEDGRQKTEDRRRKTED